MIDLRFLLGPNAYQKPRVWDSSLFVVVTLGILYVISCISRFYLSSFLPTPVVMIDELTYKTAAESFFRFGAFDQLYPLYVPAIGNFLYPSFISLSFHLGSNFYAISKLLNAILISMAIFPTFFLAKFFSQGQWPLLSVIMVMLIPSNFYANYIMPENVFFPLFLFTFLFILRAFYWNKPQDEIGAGLSLALLFLTKPHTLALIIALVSSAIALIFLANHFS